MFTASPFKLPHYGLPAFPALALLVARVWDETIDATPGSARPPALLGPLLVLFALATLAFVAAWSGVARIPPDVLAALDVTTRNLARSEEHTSELQSRPHLVCRLLLEKKKNE